MVFVSNAKSVAAPVNGKSKFLSYFYLYRMHKFNKAKERLDKLPDRAIITIARFKKSWIPNDSGMHYETPISIYYEWKVRNLAAKKAELGKKILALSAKLNNEEKCSSFVEKQVDTKNLSFFQKASRYMKSVLIIGSAGGVIFAAASVQMGVAYAASTIVSGFSETVASVVIIGIAAVSVALGYVALFKIDRARDMLAIGREKAQKLVSDVKKLAA